MRYLRQGVIMRKLYGSITIFLLTMFLMACSQSPTEPVAEESPSFYIPDWESGKSLVLSFTWVDTSGDGDVVYSGSAVSIAGRIDSIWFNFPQRCDQNLYFTITTDSVNISSTNPTLSSAHVVYEGSILSGHYTYGFEVNMNIENKSTYAVQVTPSADLPAPVMAYIRIEY